MRFQGTSWTPVPVDPLGRGRGAMELRVLVFSWEYQHSFKQAGAACCGCTDSKTAPVSCLCTGMVNISLLATAVTAEGGSRTQGRAEGSPWRQACTAAKARSGPGILAVGWFHAGDVPTSQPFLSVIEALKGSSRNPCSQKLPLSHLSCHWVGGGNAGAQCSKCHSLKTRELVQGASRHPALVNKVRIRQGSNL